MSATDAVAGRARGARKRLLLAAAAAGAVLVLVILPGYLAARPGFFGRYPGLEKQYVPWTESTHTSAACSDCHVRPGLLTRATYHARMTGEFYLSLFSRSRAPKVFGSPSNASCQSCHDDLRSVSPKGDLRIPHRAHVTILKMECVECHDFLVHELNPVGKHAPTMAACLKCHDGDTAKNECTACHTRKAAPATHSRREWLVAHAEQADDPECETCHAWTREWCADCHARRPRSHTDRWRAEHGDRVAERRNCEACHGAAFCERCHGEVPRLNFDPGLTIAEQEER